MISQVLLACPTAQKRTCWGCGLRPFPAGLSARLHDSHFRALPAPAHGAYAHAAGL